VRPEQRRLFFAVCEKGCEKAEAWAVRAVIGTASAAVKSDENILFTSFVFVIIAIPPDNMDNYLV